jgi:multisubunit Na+/H+ antiporter MnhE subunit
MKYVFAVLALSVIFVLTLASIDPWDFVIGAGLSIAMLVLFRAVPLTAGNTVRRADTPNLLTRIGWFFPFCAKAAWDIIRGTWLVFLIVSGIRKLEHPGIVLVPIGDRTPTGVAISALISTLSPGTVMMEIDFAQGVMLIHAIDASDPDQVRADHQEFYDRYQRHVFP